MQGSSHIEREKERDQITSAVRTGSKALIFPKKAFHISGERDVGKTWTVERVDEEIRNLDRVLCLYGNLAASWESLDPLERMVGLRNVISRASKGFQPEAFDILLPVFLSKFRPGFGYKLTKEEARDGLPIEESLRDAAKKILESAAGELPIGVGLAGTGAAAGAAKVAIAGGAVAGATTVAGAAASVGVIAFVTAVGASSIKHLIRTVRKTAKRRQLFARYPRFAEFLYSEQPDHDEFFTFLAHLLGEAIGDIRFGEFGCLPVLFLDPGDALADQPDGPASQVGKMLALVFRHVGRQIVVATSRQPSEDWVGSVARAETAPLLDYESIRLEFIDLEDAHSSAKADGYEGLWPVEGMTIIEDRFVRPKELADLLRRLKEDEAA